MKLPAYKLISSEINLTENTLKIYTGLRYVLPNLGLGFIKNIHNIKDAFGKSLNKFGSKNIHTKNVYEHNIQGYQKCIAIEACNYFELSKEPKILSRAFFKMWEILNIYDLTPNTQDMVSAHLAEGPGSFIQATILYRKMQYPKNNDIYHGITIHSDDKHIPEIDKDFIKHYKQYKHYKTYEHPNAYDGEDNGDLTKSTTINNFSKLFAKKKAMLITADGGFKWVNENLQEQEAFKLIFGEIIAALMIQEKKGNFVCKIFESFTNITVKLILLCQQYYEEVHIVKPFTSRVTNSEKYIVCLNFKGIQSNVTTKLLGLLDSITETTKVVDIFDVKIPQNMMKQIGIINSYIASRQYESLSKTIVSMENNNTNDFEKDVEEQKKANNSWVELFFPKNKKLSDIKKKIKFV